MGPALATKRFFFVALALAFTACSAGSAKSHYLLAEKLWSDGKYSSAVSEFEKTAAHDSSGKLGLQALFRAASTQALFLSQYDDAVRKFRQVANTTPDQAQAWDALKQIGDILFEKTDQYDLAIQHYKSLISQRPESGDLPEFMFRMGKSYFFLQQFRDANAVYRDLIKKYSQSPWAEKASFEMALADFTRGEQRPGGKGPGMESYQLSMDEYGAFIKKYPQSELIPNARFGIAACLEELDQLDAAYNAYAALRLTYPSHNVIEIKLARIRERRAQRNR